MKNHAEVIGKLVGLYEVSLSNLASIYIEKTSDAIYGSFHGENSVRPRCGTQGSAGISARSTRESDSAAGVPIAHAARRRTRAASSAGVGAPSAPGEPRDQDSPGSSGRDELSPLPGGGRKLVRAGDIATAQPDNAESSGADSDLTQSRRRRDEPGKFGSAADLPARHGGPTAPAARAAVQAGARPGRLRIGSDGALGVGLAKPPSGAATAKAAAEAQRMDWRLHQQMAALPLEGANEALDRLRAGEVEGAFVLTP